MTFAPLPPAPRLCIGVTGHRCANAAYSANQAAVEDVINTLFDSLHSIIDQERPSLGEVGTTRLHSLLADGTDQIATHAALARGWEIVAPLPFGRALNLAINALPNTGADARALLAGEDAVDDATQRRATALQHLYDKAQLFELAERDALVSRLFLDRIDDPDGFDKAQAFSSVASERVALAGRVMIEQSDIIISVWDGASSSMVGGTGHTIAAALALGAPVILINPADAQNWFIVRAPEALAAPGNISDREGELASLVRAALRPGEGGALRAGAQALASEAWHPRSSRLWTGYRRIEAMFGGGGRPFRSLQQSYETPDQIAQGSAAPILQATKALPGGDPSFADRIEKDVLRRFAWSDGISARLSDSYRGGMIANFILSALAITAGIAYQPFATVEQKWIFASAEFLLLASILFITLLGRRLRWHRRWFETRRVAEYFRHAPILLSLGVARPPGRWPRGAETSWPEYYARAGLRSVGLPHVAITTAYLHAALSGLLLFHVETQRDYHQQKAKRLTTVHHRLDRLSGRLFQLAVISVSTYLILAACVALGVLPHGWLEKASKLFTFLGVFFPTFGASVAGIRYFGDFERFAAISEVTAGKLGEIGERIAILLSGPLDGLDYARASDLVHAADDSVINEIESWQAVFVRKHITVPV